MPTRHCADCRRPIQMASRCPACERRRKQRRNRDAARCRAAVAAHRAEHGDWCPGWHRPAHESSDLTAEHPEGIDAGDQELEVLCRSCNARKGKPNGSTAEGSHPATIVHRQPRLAKGIW